jgi:hypothetical protein
VSHPLNGARGGVAELALTGHLAAASCWLFTTVVLKTFAAPKKLGSSPSGSSPSATATECLPTGDPPTLSFPVRR